MSTIEKLLLGELASKIMTLVLVGPERGARPFLRSLAAAAGEQSMALATSRDLEGWPQVTLVDATELGFEGVVRAALRQDPDFLIVEATTSELPWEMLVQSTLTGHGVLVRATDATDAGPVLERLRGLPGQLGSVAPSAFPRVLVLGPTGIEQVVSAIDDSPIWKRGDPLPTATALTGREPPPPPPAPEPLAPFDADLVRRLRRALEPRQRTTFLPVLEEPANDAARSKLSGLPMLAQGEAWPRCGECGASMPLALQLARNDVPIEALRTFPDDTGWLQLFYCAGTTCGAVNAADPSCKNKLLRFLPETGPLAAAAIPKFDWKLEPRDISGWTRAREAPHPEDNPELGEELSDAQSDLGYRLSCVGRANAPDPGLPEAPAALEPLAGARHGDKLLGWPAWTQGAEWETCEQCGERMTFVFQLDASGGALDMLFAESGTGHVSQCPTHRDQLAFRWSCT